MQLRCVGNMKPLRNMPDASSFWAAAAGARHRVLNIWSPRRTAPFGHCRAFFSQSTFVSCRACALLGVVINSDEQLTAFLPSVRAAEWVALDTEADSLHAYPEKLCLIQISLPAPNDPMDPRPA